MYVIILLSFLSFLLLIGLVMVLKIGGSTIRQIVKSKLPGYKNKGVWQVHASSDKKVGFFYKKLNGSDEVKVKSGATPQQDEYARISEIYHQHDVDGTPVIFTMDDLPFSFFLKKHHLDRWFDKIDELLKLIYYAVDNKILDGAGDIKVAVQNLVLQFRTEVKHIPGAEECIKIILDLEEAPDLKGKPPLLIINRQAPYLNKLKGLMLQKNRQIVNVFDLFKTTGYLKALKNSLFEMWQNGFLAAQQAQNKTQNNKLMLYILCGIGIILLIVGFLVYNMNTTVQKVQIQVAANATAIKNMYGVNTVPLSTGTTIGGNSPPLSPTS